MFIAMLGSCSVVWCQLIHTPWSYTRAYLSTCSEGQLYSIRT